MQTPSGFPVSGELFLLGLITHDKFLAGHDYAVRSHFIHLKQIFNFEVIFFADAIKRVPGLNLVVLNLGWHFGGHIPLWGSSNLMRSRVVELQSI